MLKGKHNPRPADSGFSRQEFLRQTGALTLLAGLLACKPTVGLALREETLARQTITELGESQKRVLNAVQMQLFPADGNGPSAEDLHALEYLQWALEDPENIEDGDKEFIVKGISWLEEESRDTYENSFVQLSSVQQDNILHQIAHSRAGENWLSLLLYYLFESLTLDPVYGGNPGGIGWRWLEHQPGFPRPTKETSYHHFV
jgi:gluconate 2-dehydrogenase gamma chain